MDNFEKELQDYIWDLCKTKNIPPVDLRFRCYGDENKFWSSKDNLYFEVDCIDYHASSTEIVKELISDVIDVLWEYATQSNHRIALYIEKIVDMETWVNVVLGSCLFEDDGILGWRSDVNC